MAICKYIDQINDEKKLQPTGHQSRARLNQIISMLDSYAYQPMVWDVFVQRVVNPQEGKTSDESVISKAFPLIATVLAQLCQFLGTRNFLIGNSLSLADLHAFPMLLYFTKTPEGQRMLEKHGALYQWLARMIERPSVVTTCSRYDSLSTRPK